MYWRRLGLALAGLLAAGRAWAGQASPELDSLMEACRAQYHIPGLAACVVKGEDVAWFGAYGYARIEDSVETAPTTVFDLASVSKTATAVCLMQLWEQGRFGLDDNVSDYLPFPVRHSGYPDSAITFRMLLTHTSGIVDYWPTFERLQRQGDPDVALRAFVEGYLVPGGEFYDSLRNFSSMPPGVAYRYSNLGIALAGYLVEALSDSFHRYAQENLFLPLGMTRTAWYFRDLDTNGMAMPYHFNGSGYARYGHQSLPDVPAGTLKSSCLQLGRFVAAMLNFGARHGVRVLDSATSVLMTTQQHASGVGLVWHRTQIGGREFWGHGGAWNGISTRIGFCREERVGMVVLANADGVGGVIEGIVLPALLDWAGTAIAEPPASEPLSGRLPALAHGVLDIPDCAQPGPALLDLNGRLVRRLQPGRNCVTDLAPGCYFVLGVARQAQRIVLLPAAAAR